MSTETRENSERRLPPQKRMVAALEERDHRYATRFLVAVRTTKIYCVPGCPAPLPKPENVDFVGSLEAAREKGCRACKRCHPDQAFLGIPPDEARYEALINDLFANPAKYSGVEDLAKAAKIGVSRLHEAIREAYHRTPLELLHMARVRKAAEMLLAGAQAGEVCFEVGFASLSVFYQQFGRLMGMAPACYGKLRCGTEFRIQLPEDFPSELFIGYLRREGDLSPLLRETDGLFLMRLASGGLARFRVQPSEIVVEVEDKEDGPAAHARLCTISALATDTSWSGAAPKAIQLAAAAPGLRAFQTADFFDGIVWAIVGQQLTFQFAIKLRRRLYELLRTGPEPWAPLRPDEVAGVSQEALREMQYSQNKARFLIGAAKALEGIDQEEVRRWPVSKVKRFLSGLHGFGPWSVNYVLMRGCAFADCVPVGDVVLADALKRYYKLETRPGPEQQFELMTPFAPFRSLATIHLWYGKVMA